MEIIGLDKGVGSALSNNLLLSIADSRFVRWNKILLDKETQSRDKKLSRLCFCANYAQAGIDKEIVFLF